MEQPKIEPVEVSIVLTTYQRPQMLKRALKSIVTQSFSNFELIIVDDGSVDETDEIVEQFKERDPRIKYIKLPKNSGSHSLPKNEGTRAATAPVICYFDDDNVMMRDHVNVLYKAYKKAPHDVVYGINLNIDDTGRSPARPGHMVNINHPSANINDRNFIDTNSVLVKKATIEKIGGWNEAYPKYADWNLWVRLKKIGATFLFVPQLVTQYHVHSGSQQLKHRFEFDRLSCKIWPEKTSYGLPKTLKVAVFTLTKDRLEYTKKSFESIHKKTKYKFDHYVVDNGSTDGTVEWLKEHEGEGNEDDINLKKVIINPENVGISKGSNQALDAIMKESGVDYDVIIKIDNDCVVHSAGYLEALIDIYERVPKMVLSPYVSGLVDHPGGTPREFGYTYLGVFQVGLVPHVGGIFCAAPASLYKGFRWNSHDYLHSRQDWEFSQYAGRNGHLLGYVENLECEHIDTTVGQMKKMPEYFELRKKEKETRYAGN